MEKLYRRVGKRYVEVKPQRFGDIDFFEFSFLVEACAGNKPIARSMFFDRVIDKYYHVLSQDERDNLFEWINRSSSFKFDLERSCSSCLLFNARFDKKNQFLVYTLFNGEEKVYETFKFEDKYYTKKDTFIAEEYITKVENASN